MHGLRNWFHGATTALKEQTGAAFSERTSCERLGGRLVNIIPETPEEQARCTSKTGRPNLKVLRFTVLALDANNVFGCSHCAVLLGTRRQRSTSQQGVADVALPLYWSNFGGCRVTVTPIAELHGVTYQDIPSGHQDHYLRTLPEQSGSHYEYSLSCITLEDRQGSKVRVSSRGKPERRTFLHPTASWSLHELDRADGMCEVSRLLSSTPTQTCSLVGCRLSLSFPAKAKTHTTDHEQRRRNSLLFFFLFHSSVV